MGDKAETFAEMFIALASTLFYLLLLHVHFGYYVNLVHIDL